jgi:hypothetical protein
MQHAGSNADDVAINMDPPMRRDRPAGVATPSSTTAESQYLNINNRLPALQTRVPVTHSSSTGSSVNSSGQHVYYTNDPLDSSLIMTDSNPPDESTRKFMSDLMKDLGIDQDENSVSIMPMPPAPLPAAQAGDAPLGDPAYAAFGLFRRRHIGLLVSVVCASLLTSCLKRGLLPVMRSELQMAEYQADAAEVLLMLPWSSMFLIGFVSDCIPILGSNRKAYVVLGWVLVSVGLFTLAIVSTAHAHEAVNGGAQSTAYINGILFLLGVACFGCILTIAMAEIYLVAMSKRERLRDRGEVVGMFLVVQFLCEAIGQSLTNTVMFRSTSLGVNSLYSLRRTSVFLSMSTVVPLVATFFFFQEDKELMRPGPMEEAETRNSPRLVDKLTRHVKLVWTLLQRESTWSVVRFLVLFVFFTEFLIRYAHLVLDEVMGITLTVRSTGKIVQELLMFGTLLVWRMFLLNVDWKYLTLLSFLGLAWLPQFVYSLLVLINDSRDLGLYVLSSSTRACVRGLIIAMQVAMAVEIAPRGAEGATVGVVMSIGTIMRLIATTASNGLSFAFDTQTIAAEGLNVKLSLIEEIAVERDPTSIKLPKALEKRVLVALLVCFGIKLLAGGGVWFLPHQKTHIQLLHQFGKSSPRYAVGTVLILALSLLIATLFNTLVVTPRTSCLHVFGGKGCTK